MRTKTRTVVLSALSCVFGGCLFSPPVPRIAAFGHAA
jgi:hypothetical protein